MPDGLEMTPEMEAEIERRADERAEAKIEAAAEVAAREVLLATVAEHGDRITKLETSDASQQRVINVLGKGVGEVAEGMEQVSDGQLLAPARRKLIGYSGGAAVGGVGVIEIGRWLIQILGG